MNTLTPPCPSLQLLDLSTVISVERCQAAFRDIPADPYVTKTLRYKAIARFKIRGGEVIRQPHAPLRQPEHIIPQHQGRERHYREFDTDEAFSREVHTLVDLFARLTGVREEDTILFQAQRTKTSPDLPGLPSVEGWHQDGTEAMMSLLCVNRQNLVGARSQVALEKGENIIFDYPLLPGEMIIFDDRRFWHYATPIEPVDSSREGYRDVFIIANLGTSWS